MSAHEEHLSTIIPLANGFRFGDWQVIPRENLLRRGDEQVRLEPKVMRLLLALVARHDEPCSRHELLDEFWPSPDTGETSLTRAISELRRALGDHRAGARYIDTIQNVGYKAIAPISPLEPTSPVPARDTPAQPMDGAEETVALARYLVARRNETDLHRAIELLSGFARGEPHHARVYAMLAYTEQIIHLYSNEPATLRTAQAREHAHKALELDGANGLAWAVLGALAHDHWQWREALDQFRRAVSFAPHDPLILHGHAELLLDLGRTGEALEMIHRACELQPVAAGNRMRHAWMLLHVTDDQVRRELDIACQLGADVIFTDNLKCLLHHRSGWNERAIQDWSHSNQRWQNDPSWMWPKTLLEYVAGGDSNTHLARTIKNRVNQDALYPGVAMFILILGKALDEAFDMAQSAIEDRTFFLVDPWLPDMRDFRADPRFQTVRASLGLSDPSLKSPTVDPEFKSP